MTAPNSGRHFSVFVQTHFTELTLSDMTKPVVGRSRRGQNQKKHERGSLPRGR